MKSYLNSLLCWHPGTTISRVDDSTVRLAVPRLARAWIVSARELAKVVRWLEAPNEEEPALLAPLLAAGVLAPAESAPSQEPWSPTRRFHTWANHSYYLDGTDPTGSARESVLAKFAGDDVERIRRRGTDLRSAPVLSSVIATAVWRASTRMRANQSRVLEATNASTLFFSYGTAHDLVVLDPTSDTAQIALVDISRFGYGVKLDGDVVALLRSAALAPTTRGIAVIGQYEDYQRRYRHDKAMRGFLVDGGRILTECANAISMSSGSARCSDSPLQSSATTHLGLEKFRGLIFGIVGFPDTTEVL